MSVCTHSCESYDYTVLNAYKRKTQMYDIKCNKYIHIDMCCKYTHLFVAGLEGMDEGVKKQMLAKQVREHARALVMHKCRPICEICASVLVYANVHTRIYINNMRTPTSASWRSCWTGSARWQLTNKSKKTRSSSRCDFYFVLSYLCISFACQYDD